MRHSIIFIPLMLLPVSLTAQDTTKRDPLLGQYILANSAELVHMTQSTFQGLITRHDLHDFQSSGVLGGPEAGGGADNLGLSAQRQMDYVGADVNGDGKDELVIARAGPTNLLTLSVSSATQAGGLSWGWTSTAELVSPWDTVAGPIRIIALNMDLTPRQEIIVCFRYSQGLRVILYDSVDQATGQLVRLGSTYFPDISFNTQEFDVAPGDFDRDGLEEVIFVFHECNPWSQHSVSIHLCDYDVEGRQLQWWPGHSWSGDQVPWASRARLKITAGDFRNLGFDEAVISATEKNGNTGRQVFSYLTIYPATHDFFMSFPLLATVPTGWSWGNGWESNAVAADLNPLRKDGDELVVAGPGELAVLKFDASGTPRYLYKTPFTTPGFIETYERKKMLAVADINADTAASASWAPEIVLAEHAASDSSTFFRVFGVNRNASDSITGLSQLYAGSAGSTPSPISDIIMGDFNGDGIRVGPPTLLTKQFVYQPIVELNVPPTHFDLLGGTAYDICKVHGTTPSEFKVTYTETQSQTSHFSTELSQSWGVSGEISGGFSAFGFKVNAYVKGSYERGYYGSRSVDTTTTASQVTQSWGDDWILATVTDYDFWEYPLYALGRHPGNVLVVIPHYRSTQWFPRRNVIARNWMADHEVGNLFSYVRKDDIAGWTGGKLLTSFTGKYISQASAGIWSLDLSTQTIEDSKLTSKIGAEVGASVKRWGVEAKLSGSYSREQISTHTSTATKDVKIEVTTSETDKSFGDSDYLLTPYIYWGQNGALVIDYAVDPSTLGNPTYGTFWDKNYLTSSDPGFILPWRLDSLKGIGGTENMKFYSTSLHVSPTAPSEGDIVHITAVVRNFSLTETSSPVTVRFYLGNPEIGGIPIIGTGGLTDISTNSRIAPQGQASVEMDWVVPPGLDLSVTIYAVIDPNNVLGEIHEDNNIGFVPLMVQGTNGIGKGPNRAVPERFELRQNWPNPFNPATVIQYDLPVRSHVILTVYDILGRTVATLANEVKEAGGHSAVFNAAGIASGMYLYRIEVQSLDGGQAKHFVTTKKMLVLK